MTLRQRWKQTSLPNKALVMIGTTTAFGTVFYAVAATVQVCIMRQAAIDSGAQVERLEKATNTAIQSAVSASSQSVKQALDLSKTSFDASVAQAKAALDATIRTSRLEQRAWINVRSEGAVVNQDGPIDIPVEVSNVGRTPAIHLEGDIIATVMSPGEVLDTSYRAGHLRNHTVGGTLLPGVNQPPTQFRAMRMLGNETANIRSSPQLADSINKGEQVIVVYGRLTYSDIFGVKHWITFCQSGSRNPLGKPIARVEGCAEYNQVDDDRTP